MLWKRLSANVALVLSVSSSGPESIVTGGGMSPISHSHSAGVSSTSPAGVLARTSRLCSSWVRPVYLAP